MVLLVLTDAWVVLAVLITLSALLLYLALRMRNEADDDLKNDQRSTTNAD